MFYVYPLLTSFSFNQTVLDNGVKRINIVFGALDINVTKVISTHGTIDPWYRLGVLEDLNAESPTIVITGRYIRSHCTTILFNKQKKKQKLK